MLFRSNIALAALSPPASLACTNVAAQFEEIARRRSYFFSGMLVSSYSSVLVRSAATQARLRLARTVMAIEKFRSVRGRLPEKLGELAPQFLSSVPADPFDGAPLHYRRLAKGYVIYSIDADGKDDGGREKPQRLKPTDKSSYDLTFIVER